uniref:hypothetical protein n=1 Tax=uncultured Sphingomonas sp. TaxID=158754 RepID=UPI0025E42E79|nr:hypothetical protein [uncultured Sphingomonas sp.]
MKRAFTFAAVVAGGLLAGGGASLAVAQLRPAEQVAGRDPSDEPPQFVPAGSVLVPLVFEDGQLAGYASIDVQLQVVAEESEAVAARMPLLLHAINLRTFRTPLAAGADGRLPDLQAFRRLVAIAADTAFGRGRVRHVAITQARPA